MTQTNFDWFLHFIILNDNQKNKNTEEDDDPEFEDID